MRYFFKVGENVIPMVTSIKIDKSPRNRVVNTNINGNMLIDQQAVKSTIKLNVALMSSEVMDIFVNAMSAGFVWIYYYDGLINYGKQATCKRISQPEALYVNSDKLQGVYYSNVDIEFEEK